MKATIKVIMTGHYEDRGRDSMTLVFGNDESEEEIVRAMAETYYLDRDDNDNEIELPDSLTWEWLADTIEHYAWWVIDEREVEVKILEG